MKKSRSESPSPLFPLKNRRSCNGFWLNCLTPGRKKGMQEHSEGAVREDLGPVAEVVEAPGRAVPMEGAEAEADVSDNLSFLQIPHVLLNSSNT
jgi:hypothetical protein